MDRLGLKPVADFRQRFRGKSDAAIFRRAYDKYWPRCSRDYLVVLGEYCRGLKNGLGRAASGLMTPPPAIEDLDAEKCGRGFRMSAVVQQVARRRDNAGH